MDKQADSTGADVHSPGRRSFNMSRIRGRDTKPEMLIRRGLHARGFRFRLHVRGLPGRPDLVFPGRRAVILIHGCFWHGHDCPMFRLPATRPDFWRTKIEANRVRDARDIEALAAATWRRLTVWECALRGPARQTVSETLDACEKFLTGSASSGELTGRWAVGEGQ
jgi:DNA mismatch endonuclease (patch repair protein)